MDEPKNEPKNLEELLLQDSTFVEDVKELLQGTGGKTFSFAIPNALQGGESSQEKEISGNLFEIKKEIRKIYDKSPNVGATVNRFSSWVWGNNSFVYSNYLKLQEYLDDFVDDWFNDLNQDFSEFVHNMLLNGETFPIITILNLKGKIRVRVIEDDHIKGQTDDNGFGVITDPDDITTKVFYVIEEKNSERLVPDVNVLWNPELYTKIKNANPPVRGFDDDLLKAAKWQGPEAAKFLRLTGTPFKQFIIPWKNLLGIKNLKRSISAIRRIMEWDRYYDQMLKNAMMFIKAVMGYTDVFEFDNDIIGMKAFIDVRNKLKTEEGRKELYNAGITKPKKSGDTLILRPGMKYKKEATNLSVPMSGWFTDFLDRISAGLDTPADMNSSNSTGATHASLKLSRQAPTIQKDFIVWRFQQYLRNRFFKSIFRIQALLNPGSIFNKKFTVMESFLDEKTGKPKEFRRKLPLHHEQILHFSFPDVNLDPDDNQVKGMFGSKHHGYVDEMDLSQNEAAKRLNLNHGRSRLKRIDEDRIWGKKKILIKQDKEANININNNDNGGNGGNGGQRDKK